jgi:hypothetical protein
MYLKGEHEMLLRKCMSVIMSAVFCLSSMGIASAAVPDTVQAKLAVMEKDTYGGEQTGAIADRINKLEKDYDGAHSTGSMMQRTDHIYGSLYKNAGGPSLMTKLNAIEWGINHKVSMEPVQDRITNLETDVQGKTAEGSFRTRVTRLGTFAFGSETLPINEVKVPANTLIKIALVDPVNSKDLKKGDTVKYQVADDVILDGVLLFAKGEPGVGTVTKVEPARNFGRNAEVNIDFNDTKAMDGTEVETFIGEEAKKEMKNLAMAAGASIAGMVLLGPIGIIGGAFVHGKDINLPAGTELYIQTKADTTLYGVMTTAQ